jgi:hypothetical protein
MPNTDLTTALIRDDVLSTLGYSGVDVELEDSDIAHCSRQTLRIYNRFRPRRFSKAIAVTSSTKKYELTTATHPGLVGVTEVNFVRSDLSDTGDPFNSEDNTLLGLTTFGGETFGEVALRRMYVEDSRRVVSSEPEWHTEWELDTTTTPATNTHYLYIDVPSSATYHCSYVWNQHYTPDADASTGMQNIPAGDVEWVMAMIASKAKQILSRIRGKFEGIPNPDGSSDTVDFSTLAQEGREEEERLIEDLKLRRRPLPPVTG